MTKLLFLNISMELLILSLCKVIDEDLTRLVHCDIPLCRATYYIWNTPCHGRVELKDQVLSLSCLHMS